MDAVTVASYVTDVNNHFLQNTKYHSALDDLHRAEEEKWTAQINSERAHSISMAHNAQLADLRAERDAAEVALKQIIVCLQAGEERLERAQRRVKRAWLDKPEIDEEANKAHIYLSRSKVRLSNAASIFQREAEQHRVLPVGGWDACVCEDYRTPPPEFACTSSQTEQVEAMSVSCSLSEMPHLVVEGTTGTPSLVSEPPSQPLTQPSVVAIRPLRSSRTRSIAARHQPYFRSAVNILKWQMQQPEGNGDEADLEKLEAASVRERLVKSLEAEYMGEMVSQDCEEECAEAKELLRKDKGDNKGMDDLRTTTRVACDACGKPARTAHWVVDEFFCDLAEEVDVAVAEKDKMQRRLDEMKPKHFEEMAKFYSIKDTLDRNEIHLGVYLDFDEAKTPGGKLYKHCERVRKRKEKSDMLFSKAEKRFIPFRTKYEAAMESLAKANRRLISANTEYVFSETLKSRKEKERLAQLACNNNNITIKIEASDASLLDTPEVKIEAFPEEVIGQAIPRHDLEEAAKELFPDVDSFDRHRSGEKISDCPTRSSNVVRSGVQRTGRRAIHRNQPYALSPRTCNI
ncbi:hypothetical protein GQ607_004515 [Colletotrichum asianum]|uniref:Uncharacterized protein n=1 Tax=Colletotrichum asianum TaxID=702518 RepID=A0A8H3WHY8_9PEZI|nr:hypothetical protein GQ607_004515 [Colletotrichum asianum]